jgi:CRP-like cAMP-binding protein
MLIVKASLFEGMSAQLMSKIEEASVEEVHHRGDFLFRQGEPADHLFILLEGRVRLSVGQQGQVALVVKNPGDWFGWSSLVDRETYTASAECIAHTKLAKIRSEALAHFFEREPASGMIFYKRLAGMIGNRLVNCYKLLPSAHGEKRSAPGG